jgi:hypothetical protein
MRDQLGVEKFMGEVASTIRKYHPQPSDEFTEIYNRAYEAVEEAIKECLQLTDSADIMCPCGKKATHIHRWCDECYVFTP